MNAKEFSSEDRSVVAVTLFANLLSKYSEYLSLKRQKRIQKRSRHLMRVQKRPLSYCYSGYKSDIFKGVIANDAEITKKYLKVSPMNIQRIIEMMPEKTHEWSRRFETVVFLYWLACGANYRVTGASFNISRYTARDIVHRSLDIFVELLPLVIKYPPLDELDRIGSFFNQRAGTIIFSNAVGVIDETHFKVSVPIELRDQYLNKKLDTTIQLQAVCDNNGKFLSICVGYPGSVHCQRVLRNSEIYKKAIFPPQGYFLLGDIGYNCALLPIAIITPYKTTNQTLSAIQEKFNLVHSKARNVIESSFGIMKAKWQSIFKKTLELEIENVIKTITACCIMHNICLEDSICDEVLERHDTIENNEVDSSNYDPEAFRNSLAQQLQANIDIVI